MQGATPVNVDNISAASRRPASATKKLTIFVIRSKVKEMLKGEKEKAYVSSIFVDLKPLYAIEVATKPFLVG